jgi:predicted unusual protein kinase regulating ubiquinone biosynthesis (AarF/ABC1/UbiB family)
MPSNKSKFTTSRSSRFFKLGRLSSVVGSSYLGESVKGVFIGAEAKARSLLATNTKNAMRVASTFGELKGAVMKVGQMMSLQEDLLPPEMREILRGLQNQAPPVPFDQMRPLLEAELGATAETLFSEISDQAYASASIGQVHWARLEDGREVAVKIQYPDVDQMVESDLKNLRMFVRSASRLMPVKADIDKFFQEARSRLTEELDYRLELMNMLEFQELFQNDYRFIIPAPVRELSSKRVLTTEFQAGLSAEQICAPEVAQSRRDKIGADLFDAVLVQFFDFHALQSDPNLANFAFTDDDRIIMYDFGCVKRFPSSFVDGVRVLMADAMNAKYGRLEKDLEQLGYIDRSSRKLPLEVYRAYADIGFREWRRPGLFNFGTTRIHQQIIELNKQYWTKALDFDAPADAMFLDRCVGGMYGNLRKLKANVPMHDLLRKYLKM